jgi:hypothetical protein
LIQGERYLSEKLKGGTSELTNCQKENLKLVAEKAQLEKELESMKDEIMISESKVRWYQKYAEEKDFEVKAVFWKQYFKDLSKSEHRLKKLKSM